MKKDLFLRTVDDIVCRCLAKGEAISEAGGESKLINSLLDNGYDLDEVCDMGIMRRIMF